MLYYAGEEVAIDSGTNQGLQVGQRFFVRRPMSFRGAPRAEHTVGWLRIVRASQSTATATIDFTCDAVVVGDHLEPYVEPVLPPGIDRTDSTGTPDPSKAATVLYGNDGRQLGGDRDFMLASAGRDKGVEPGARYAVYHHGGAHGEQRVAFGEAVVVSVFADKALLRITDANDTVSTGDMLVLRLGGTGLFADTGSDAQERVLDGAGDEGSSPAARRSVEASTEPLRSVAFEDLSFDFDRYTLKAEALTLLDQAVGVLQENPTVRIQIEGYSCNIGTAKYNLALGERRANAVRDYLMNRGVQATQMTTVSYGEERPKYDNAREDTRRLNRRAALVVNIQR
jgi:outer membrane protein OmpA-like peptidoglycan-associated protein